VEHEGFGFGFVSSRNRVCSKVCWVSMVWPGSKRPGKQKAGREVNYESKAFPGVTLTELGQHEKQQNWKIHNNQLNS